MISISFAVNLVVDKITEVGSVEVLIQPSVSSSVVGRVAVHLAVITKRSFTQHYTVVNKDERIESVA